jgi:hypothetical protein
MNPLTLWQRFLGLVWTPFVWTQCKAELPIGRKGSCAYCVRRKWHGGAHVTYNGQEFYVPPDYGYRR